MWSRGFMNTMMRKDGLVSTPNNSRYFTMQHASFSTTQIPPSRLPCKSIKSKQSQRSGLHSHASIDSIQQTMNSTGAQGGTFRADDLEVLADGRRPPGSIESHANLHPGPRVPHFILSSAWANRRDQKQQLVHPEGPPKSFWMHRRSQKRSPFFPRELVKIPSPSVHETSKEPLFFPLLLFIANDTDDEYDDDASHLVPTPLIPSPSDFLHRRAGGFALLSSLRPESRDRKTLDPAIANSESLPSPPPASPTYPSALHVDVSPEDRHFNI